MHHILEKRRISFLFQTPCSPSAILHKTLLLKGYKDRAHTLCPGFCAPTDHQEGTDDKHITSPAKHREQKGSADTLEAEEKLRLCSFWTKFQVFIHVPNRLSLGCGCSRYDIPDGNSEQEGTSSWDKRKHNCSLHFPACPKPACAAFKLSYFFLLFSLWQTREAI